MNDATDHTERRSAIGHRRQKATEQKPNQAEAAKVLLPQLEEKLSLARARQGEISRERTAVALAAHMGSANDRARLDELNHDGAILAGEVEGLDAAVAQAKARIAEAEANAAAEVESGKRREVVGLADEIRCHGERIDSLWRNSIEEYDALQAKLQQIVQLGVGRPTQQQVRVACQRALVAAFIGSPLQSQVLAPNARHTVTDLVSSWANAAKTWAGKDAA